MPGRGRQAREKNWKRWGPYLSERQWSTVREDYYVIEGRDRAVRADQYGTKAAFYYRLTVPAGGERGRQANAMTCKDVASFLMDYLDGELADASRRIFDAHLAECPDCVRYIERYRETIRLAKDAVDDEAECDAPESLVNAILAARRKGN